MPHTPVRTTGNSGKPRRAAQAHPSRRPLTINPGQGPFALLSTAEAVGFEPTVTLLPRRFSRPFPSAARARLPAVVRLGRGGYSLAGGWGRGGGVAAGWPQAGFRRTSRRWDERGSTWAAGTGRGRRGEGACVSVAATRQRGGFAIIAYATQFRIVLLRSTGNSPRT